MQGVCSGRGREGRMKSEMRQTDSDTEEVENICPSAPFLTFSGSSLLSIFSPLTCPY